jgi:hypothetical protein
MMLSWKHVACAGGMLWLTGCVPVGQQAYNELAANPQLQLCLMDHGIPPDSLGQCLRNHSQEADADALRRACVQPDQLTVMQRCYLQQAATAQANSHSTHCYQTIAGFRCDSN